MATSKRRNRNRGSGAGSHRYPTPERFVQLWNRGCADPDANLRFLEAGDELFRAGRLSPERLKSVIRRVEPHDRCAIHARLLSLAVDTLGRAVFEDGVERPYFVELFSILVLGDVEEMERRLPGMADDIRTQVSETGFVPHHSAVVVEPILFAPEVLKDLHPQRVHDIRSAYEEMLLTGGAGSLAESGLLPPAATPCRQRPDRCTRRSEEGMFVGPRFLLGARLSILDERQAEAEPGNGHGLPTWWDEPGPEVVAAREAWQAAFAHLRGQFAVWCPTPLNMTGPDIAEGLLVQDAVMRAWKDVVAEVSPDAELIEYVDISLRGRDIHLAATRGGALAAEFTAPTEVIGPHIPELIMRVDARYPITVDPKVLRSLGVEGPLDPGVSRRHLQIDP